MSSKFQLNIAARVINNNGVISYPTESVFGLGCSPISEEAVNKILQLKQRPVEKGLILIAGELSQLEPYININKEEEKKILNKKTATTWLVKKSPLTPTWISGNHSKVAIRLSKHPLITRLCSILNQPIVSTSANPSGANPAMSSLKSRQYFSTLVDIYLNDNTPLTGQPTSIIDLETSATIRK